MRTLAQPACAPQVLVCRGSSEDRRCERLPNVTDSAAQHSKKRHKYSFDTHSSNKTLSRRNVHLCSITSPFFAANLFGSDDATTVLNSILGAYGLPSIKQDNTFKLYDDFDNDYTFEYPKSWVARSNTLRDGVYIGNFKTADRASVEIFPEPKEPAFLEEVLVRLIYPGQEVGGTGRLELPPVTQVKTEDVQIGQQRYTYMYFPTETITRSGYQVKRKNFAVATSRRGQVYSLVASARSDQFDADKEALLSYIVQSFRVR